MFKNYSIFLLLLLLGACNSAERKYEIPEVKDIYNGEDRTKLLEYLNGEIDSKNNLFENLVKRATYYLEENKVEEALNDIEHAEKLNPNSGNAYFVKANILKHVGKDQAIAAAKNAEQLGYRTPDLYLLLANLSTQKGDKESANEYLTIAESLYPNYHELYYHKGDYDLLVGDTSKAMGNFRIAYQKNPNYFEPYNKLIGLYQRFDQRDSLSKIYKVALNKFPERTELLYQKARMLEGMDDEDSARVVYTQYLEKVPKDIDARIRLANLYFTNKYFTSAYNQYKVVLDSIPTKEGIAYLAAISKEKVGDYEEAKKLYRKAWELKPNSESLVKDIRRMDSYQRRGRDIYTEDRRSFNSVITKKRKKEIEEEEPEPIVRKKFPTINTIESKKEIEIK